ARSGKLLRRCRGHTDFIWDVVFSPDGQQLASISSDKTLRLWDVKTGTVRHVCHHESSPSSVAFTPDGATVLTAGAGAKFQHEIRAWEVSTGADKGTWGNPGDQVERLAFSPRGRYLAYGCNNGKAVLYDYQAQQGRRTLDCGTHVDALAFS